MTEQTGKPTRLEQPDDLELSGSLVGRRIGRYQVVRLVGSGGMGTVYEAQQDHPARRVALKVLKSGIASEAAMRRFEHESELLGRLRHPGVAQVYEAGVHRDATGEVPYFALEYIEDARTLTTYAAESKLDQRRRLELFGLICDAVQHGHQRGVIHRDLKPANILIDRLGQPKVIDFGVARATDSDVTLTTVQTDVARLVGTLRYMSPEQCRGDSAQIDTRSDVYGAGVVLYELLTGTHPYELAETSFYELPRVIRDEPPRRPSTFDRSLRGDIETIVLKALEKDRERRYQSMAALADDIRRCLRREPIQARPPSTAYQLQMFARRNRALVAGAALTTLALLAGTAVATWQAVRATHAEGRALTLARSEVELRFEAQRQAEIAEAVNDFLNEDLLAAVSPSGEPGRGRNVSMREVLDAAGRRIDTAAAPGGRFAAKPLVEAAVRETLGRTYFGLGEYDAARTHQERALELYRRVAGPEDGRSQTTLNDLGLTSRELGWYDEARMIFEQVLDVERRIGSERHELGLAARTNLGTTLAKQGRYDEAIVILEEVLARKQQLFGDEDLRTLRGMTSLAFIYREQGEFDRAEALYETTLEIRRRVLGPDDPEMIGTLQSLGTMHIVRGRHGEAEPLMLEALDAARRVLGESHSDTLMIQSNLALMYKRQGRYDEAESLYVRTLETRTSYLGPTHPSTLMTAHNLGILWVRMGRYEDAEAIHLETLEARRRILGDEHPDTLKTIVALANAYRRLDRLEEARSLIGESLEAYRRLYGDDHPDTARTVMNLAMVHSALDGQEEAEQLFREALDASERLYGESHPATLTACSIVGEFYMNQGRLDRADELFDRALGGRRRTLGAEHPDTLRSVRLVATLRMQQERLEEAERLLTDGRDATRRVLGDGHPDARLMAETLAALYEQQGRADEAAALLRAIETNDR